MKLQIAIVVWSLKFEVDADVWSWSLKLKITLDKNENGVKCIKWINKRMELNEMNEAMNEINK